jgi:hypothetical protein
MPIQVALFAPVLVIVARVLLTMNHRFSKRSEFEYFDNRYLAAPLEPTGQYTTLLRPEIYA